MNNVQKAAGYLTRYQGHTEARAQEIISAARGNEVKIYADCFEISERNPAHALRLNKHIIKANRARARRA